MNLTPFGSTRRGEPVHQITLSNNKLKVKLLTQGARIQDVRLASIPWSLTAGSDNLADYDGGPLKNFGCLVGPAAGRFRGATARIGDRTHSWPANDNGNLLHGGDPAGGGWHEQVWEVLETTDTTATLQLERTTEEDGFPGHRRLLARFELEDCTLRMTVTGESDTLTLLNPANHSFWTPDGTNGLERVRLQIAAEQYLPVRDDITPVWPPQSVTDSLFDFRQPAPLPEPGALDHCFCLSGQPQPVRPIARLSGSQGVGITLASTEPGLVVFNGWGTNEPAVTGHDGMVYGPNSCLALEAQHWPDAPNLPGAASIEYGPERPYRQITEWQFSAE